ncbi:uncharacterized protein [Onthophagus taurus]|uniref:uncharacterized protein n=1 Tax=Onthophagus taurus TaxID=166361 RepID=UPI0039BE9A1E
MDVEKKKRMRSLNYSCREKEVLLSIVSSYKNIVENRKTDCVSAEQKLSIWKVIADEFNSQSPNSCYRSVDSLKKYYENQKKILRKKVAEERKHIYTTGGGKQFTIIEPDDGLLLSLVNKKTLYGFQNEFDSDFIQNVEEHPIDPCLTENNNTEETTTTVIEDYMDGINENLDQTNTKDITSNTLRQSTSSTTSKKNNYSQIKRNKVSRRRPTTVKTFTSTRLAEKYEELVCKKLEYMECLKEEHKLRMEALKLDLEIKKKQLENI